MTDNFEVLQYPC